MSYHVLIPQISYNCLVYINWKRVIRCTRNTSLQSEFRSMSCRIRLINSNVLIDEYCFLQLNFHTFIYESFNKCFICNLNYSWISYQRVRVISIIERFSLQISWINQSSRKNLGFESKESSSMSTKKKEIVSSDLSSNDSLPWARVSELIIGML